MTPEEIRSVIMSHTMSSWATCTEIAFPNQDFNAPSDGSSWIRPVVKMGDSVVGELGDDGVGWRSGVLMNSIFTKPGDGSKVAMDLATRFEGMFRRRCLSGVIFDEPSTGEGRVENSWYHVMVIVNFQTLVGE